MQCRISYGNFTCPARCDDKTRTQKEIVIRFGVKVLCSNSCEDQLEYFRKYSAIGKKNLGLIVKIA